MSGIEENLSWKCNCGFLNWEQTAHQGNQMSRLNELCKNAGFGDIEILYTENGREKFAKLVELIGRDVLIEAELLGKKLGRKYALIEIGNMVWISDRLLAKKLYAMANEIKEV